MKIFLANFLWSVSTLPSAAAFALAVFFPERAQRRAATRIRRTAGGPVIRRVPTSGSTGATKWVPYTRELLREFARAVNPWVFSLYVRHPSLLFATHYWSITLVPVDEADVPQGEDIPVEADEEKQRYLVFLSTGNGARKEPLGDVVRCTGRIGRTPTFEFLHRAGGVSDLHGEKLHPGPVADALAAVAREIGGFATAFLVPRSDRRGYRLVCTLAHGARAPEVHEVERELARNYYYRHTRNLTQLDPVVIDVVPDALAVYCASRQIPPAAEKVPPLVANLSHCG